MSNESEAKIEQDTTKEEPPAVEGHMPRARADSLMEAHELTRTRTRYEEVTADHERAQTRAESRRSHGSPKGFAHVRAVASDIWTHHISIIVSQDKVRDHLVRQANLAKSVRKVLLRLTMLPFVASYHRALERTFLSYLKTSQAFALLSVLISQLFKLQHRQNPDRVLGYDAVGKPLAIICMCMAIFYMLVGAFRWWRLQQGLVHGKAIAAGIELALVTIGTALLVATLFALSIAIAIRRENS